MTISVATVRHQNRERISKVHILCVGDAVMSEPFRGQIRKEDVRAVEKDRVEMYRSFRWTKLNIYVYNSLLSAAWYLSIF